VDLEARLRMLLDYDLFHLLEQETEHNNSIASYTYYDLTTNALQKEALAVDKYQTSYLEFERAS
jgi:hypothetical protein